MNLKEADEQHPTTAAISTAFDVEPTMVMHPFIPNPSIKWKLHNLNDKNFLFYDDPVVEAEFSRFLHRDHSALGIGVGFTIGSLVFTLLGLIRTNNLFNLYFSVAIGVIFLTLTIVDLVAFHCGGPSWPKTPAVRQGVYIAYGFFAVVLMSFTLVIDMSFCDDKIPNMPVDVKRQQCLNILNQFVLHVLAIFFFMLKFRIVFVYVFAAMELLAFFLGGALIWKDILGWSGVDLAIMIIMHVSAGIVGCVTSAIRYSILQRQFEQSITLEIVNRDTIERQLHVDTLLSTMVPDTVLAKLLNNEPILADDCPSATILFSDMASFTAWSSSRSAREVVEMLNVLCVEFDGAATEAKVEKVKTIGDAYWAISGIPQECEDHAERMVNFALQMQLITSAENEKHPEWRGQRNPEGVRLRIGIHSGRVFGSILGTTQVSYEVFGETNDVAGRAEQRGRAGRVAVTQSVLDRYPACSVEEEPVTAEDGSVAWADPNEEPRVLFLVKEDRQNSRTNEKRHSVGGVPHSARTTYTATAPKNNNATATDQSEGQQRRREAFIARQAARQGLLIEGGKESAEQTKHRYTTREYNCFFLNLQDQEAEEEYKTFAITETLQLRAGARYITGVFIAICFLCLLIDESPVPWYSIVLLSVAQCFSLVTAVHSFFFQLKYLWVDCFFHHATLVLLELGLGLNPNEAIVSNDLAYLYAFLSVLGTFSTPSPIPAWVLVTLNLVFFYIPLCALTAKLVFFANALGFTVLVMAVVCFLCFLYETMLRQQFRELKLAEAFQNLNRQQMQAQEALFSTMVPSHVIPALMQWVAVDLDPRQGIAKDFPSVVLAFLKFYRQEDEEVAGVLSATTSPLSTLAAWLQHHHTKTDAILARFPALVKIKTVGEMVMLAGPFETEKFSVKEAAQQMLQAVVAITQELKHVELLAGMHVGAIFAAVIGVNRLNFDIFGDSVNTASRVMSTGKELQKLQQQQAQFSPVDSSSKTAKGSSTSSSSSLISASEEFLELLQSSSTGVIKTMLHTPDEEGQHDMTTATGTNSNSGSSIVAMVEVGGQRFGPRQERLAKGKGTLRVRQMLFV